MAHDVTIVPAVLEKDFASIKEKIGRAEGVSDWIQIDIADGAFVPNETWRNADDLKKLHPDIKIEMHLMVEHPEREVDRWIDAGAARLIAHVGAFKEPKNVDAFIAAVRGAKRAVGLALNPETSVGLLTPHLSDLDVVLFLSVNPGFSGQPFVEGVIDKVRAFHEDHPEVIIAVDGGMNPERAKKMVEAGAIIINSGSTVWSYPTLEEGIAAFKNEL